MTPTPAAPDIATGREAAELLGVPPKRVAKWVEDEKVHPVGLIPGRSRGGRGVKVFRLDDFRPLAAAYHARRATSSAALSDVGGSTSEGEVSPDHDVRL